MRLSMKKVLCDKASRKHNYIMALSITMVMFLILVSIASVASYEDIKNSDSNNAFNFNKFDKAISAYDKAIEINSQNSSTLYNHAFFCSPINKTGNISVHILAINDFHGQLEPPSDDAGGAEYLATYIKKFKSENPNTIVVSAGDNIGASPLISAHFHDEPTIKALSMMGFDFSAVGNHELDKGLDELMRIQYGDCHPDGCLGNSSFEGAHFQYLAANIVNNSTNDLVFPAYAVTYVQGVPIGFIGIALESTPMTVSKFAVKGLKFLNETETINKYVKELKDNKGVKTIVVLIHNGGCSQDRESLNNTQLDQKDSKSMHILDVVNNTDRSVTVFITGHTHQAYNELVDGRNVTQAYAQGKVLTDIDLVISNETQAVIEKRARNIIVSRDVPKDSGVAGLIMRYKSLVAPIADKVIGSIKGNFTAEPNEAGESTLGDLIADAQLNYTHNPSYGGADVAFTNPESIRSNLNLSGSERQSNVTYGQVFSVQPFGNKLVTMTLNGTQIKDLLENQLHYSDNKSSTLQVSKGFGYTWNKSAPVGKKINISGIKINGTSIDPNNPSYHVTMDSFMAERAISILEAGNRINESSLDGMNVTDLDDVNVTANYFSHSKAMDPEPGNRIVVVE
jgi:5'-nucleotidase